MATIRPNDNAPAEEAKYILPTVTFDLAAGGSFETDDRAALAAAEAHPWLEVEYDAAEEANYSRPERSVPYNQDYLSAVNSVAFDMEAVREAEEAKLGVEAQPLAVDAGLDQDKLKTVGRGDQKVSLTLAADEAAAPADDDNDKPAAKRGSKEG